MESPSNSPPQDDPDEQHQTEIKSHAKPKSYTNPNEVENVGFFDDYLYRHLAWSGILFLFCLLGIPRMFNNASTPDCGYPEWHKDYKTISIGYTVCGIGLILILLASLIALILSTFKKRIFGGFILFILLLLGSLIYIVGSWIIVSEIAYIYCIVGASGSLLGGYGCIYFGEFLLIGFIAILCGIDLWKSALLNDFKLRMILFCSFVAFCALITFFGYAILGNYLYKLNLSEYTSTAQDYLYTASGWFFVFLSMVIYLIVLLTVKKPIIYLICSFVLILSTFLCAIGYWALIKHGEDADNAYYIAMSFFLIEIGFIFAIDMSLGQFIKKYILKR